MVEPPPPTVKEYITRELAEMQAKHDLARQGVRDAEQQICELNKDINALYAERQGLIKAKNNDLAELSQIKGQIIERQRFHDDILASLESIRKRLDRVLS